MVILLIGSNVYQITSKNKIQTTLNTKIDEVSLEKDALQTEFIASSARVDSLSAVTTDQEGKLNASQTEIKSLEAKIRQILKNERLTTDELSQAKALIASLNSKIADLASQVAQLQEENQKLTNENQQLNTNLSNVTQEKEKVQEKLFTTEKEKAAVEDIASTMNASDFKFTAILEKKNGKQKETTSARKTNLFKVEFTLNNRLAESGEKDIYVVVLNPENKVVTDDESLKFTTREDGELQYSDKIKINFEKGKPNPVSYNRKVLKPLKGDYIISVYQNGFKIGEGRKTLK